MQPQAGLLVRQACREMKRAERPSEQQASSGMVSATRAFRQNLRGPRDWHSQYRRWQASHSLSGRRSSRRDGGRPGNILRQARSGDGMAADNIMLRASDIAPPLMPDIPMSSPLKLGNIKLPPKPQSQLRNGCTCRQCRAMSTRRVIHTSGLLWI